MHADFARRFFSILSLFFVPFFVLFVVQKSCHAAEDFPAASARCKISGSIQFLGDPPPRKALDWAGHSKVKEFYKGIPFLDERYVIDERGGVQHCLIYVSKGLERFRFETPKDPIVLDQLGYRFEPHVFGIMAGQKLTIRNLDEDAHNIHCICNENAGFNIAQPNKDTTTQQKFDSAESPFRIQCDLHIWMQAWCGVFAHPFFCVSAVDGTFELPALPSGNYEITAWHERLGTQSFAVELKKDETKSIVFTYGENAPAPREQKE